MMTWWLVSALGMETRTGKQCRATLGGLGPTLGSCITCRPRVDCVSSPAPYLAGLLPPLALPHLTAGEGGEAGRAPRAEAYTAVGAFLCKISNNDSIIKHRTVEGATQSLWNPPSPPMLQPSPVCLTPLKVPSLPWARGTTHHWPQLGPAEPAPPCRPVSSERAPRDLWGKALPRGTPSTTRSPSRPSTASPCKKSHPHVSPRLKSPVRILNQVIFKSSSVARWDLICLDG